MKHKLYPSKQILKTYLLVRIFFVLIAFVSSLTTYAQGTWTKIATNAPVPNMGVMLQLTDGTVICHDTNGGGTGLGTGWNKLTPDIHGSYVNGTWSTIAPMNYDRLFFASQVLPSGKVFVAGGEYGPGGKHGEVYDPVANTWTLTGDPPTGYNIYDGNSEILPSGSVLLGPQITPSNTGYDCEFFTPSTNLLTNAPTALYNHDEAAWLKLPDSSILFVGILSTSSNRYIPSLNTWVNDGTVPVNLYDAFGGEAGAAFMLPNGKAIFFGATGQNAYYTPSGNTSPGTWTVAPSFPTIGGIQLGTTDASAAMMSNGKILCALSFIGTSANDEFRSPTYFYEFDYTTNTFTQVTSNFPGLGVDSLPGVSCYQTCMLDLPDGTVLLGINQAGPLSSVYYVYNPVGGPLAAGKPIIHSISQANCPIYNIYGTGFNGITEGAAFGDDWQMSTNYPLVRLTSGTNVYYAKTFNWNRIGAVQTDSLADTVQFTLPAGLPNGTYSLVLEANGNPSNALIITTPCSPCSTINITMSSTGVKCNGGSTGSATATPTNGVAPYTYAWSPSGGNAAIASNLSASTYTVTVHDANNCTGTASVIVTQPATALGVATGSIINVLCKGSATGSATATPTGGTTPYTYAWAPSGGNGSVASNLTAGTYTITVTDANACTATATAIITQPATTLGVTTGSIVNILCNGGNTGSATATASNGTTPYTYAWTPSGGSGPIANGLTAGTYTITVNDANGCMATATAIITQPAVLGVTTTITNVKCNGGNTGSATANPSGGTTPYTYAWTPSGGSGPIANGLTAGTYTITLTDAHGCSASANAVITQPATALGVTTGSIVNVTCSGTATGSATATPTGGTTPYTYAWTPSGGNGAVANNLTAGTYTITITDANNCTATANAVITQPATALGVTIGSIVNEPCNGGNTGSATATASNGTAPYTYTWTPSGGNAATANSLTAGTYTITVKDAQGCTATATAIITQPAVLAVTTTITNVKCNGGSTGSATANPSGGTIAYTYLWAPSGGNAITANGLTAGTYTVTVTDANNCTATATAIVGQPAVLSVTTTVVNVKCTGAATGSATAHPLGGTTPYTYAWALTGGNGVTANALTAGTYTVTLTDANGCSATASATITQPATVLGVTTSTTPAFCNNNSGSATATPSGGTPAYTYLWAPSGGNAAIANNLTAGTYTITLKDANACIATATAIVTQPVPVAAAITSKTNVTCNGGSDGSATVTGSNGTLPYTYLWTPSGATTAMATGLTVGTYTASVTDAANCTGTTSVTLTQPPAIGVTPTAPSICFGGAGVSLTASNYTTYTWAPAAGLSATTGATVTANPTVTTLYTVTGTSGICQSSTTVLVTVNTIPVISVVPPAPNLCSGDSLTLRAYGATTYTWAPAANLSATSGVVVTAFPPSTATYTVTGKTNGCTATQQVTITVSATPTVTVSPPVSICSGGNTILNAGGATTYAWSPATGLSATTGATVTANPVVTTSYTVTGTTGLCGNSARVTVTVKPTPTVVVNNTASTICSGGTGTNITASGATTYSWLPVAGLSSTTAATVTANPTLTTTYTVTGTTNTCSGTANSVITVTPTPTVTVTPPTSTICPGGNVILTASGATTYTWAPATGLSATIGNIVTASPTVTTTYTVTGTSGTCSSSTTITVKVDHIATINITPASSVLCSGNGVLLTASGSSNYTWSPATGLSATTGAIVTASPTITTTYTVSNGSPCPASTDSVTVTINPTPTITVTPSSSSLCSGKSVPLAASGATNFTWTPATGLTSTTGANDTASPNASTTYTVTGSTGSCSSSRAVAITVNATPAVKITPDSATICAGGAGTTLTAGGAVTYAWAPPAGLSATSGINVNANPATQTTYTVTGMTSAGCTNIDSATIKVDIAVVASVTVTKDSICKGDTSTLTASGGGTYRWNTGSTNASIIVRPATSSIYTVTVTKNVCSATATDSVIVVDPPIATISQSNDTLRCTPTGLASYQWYKNGVIITGATHDTLITSKPATYKVNVTNSFGCSDSATYTRKTTTGVNELSFDEFINVYPNPTNGNLHIDCSVPEGDYIMSLTDVIGQVLYTSTVHMSGNYSGNINMSSYSPGLYILTIRDNRSITEKKIMLSK